MTPEQPLHLITDGGELRNSGLLVSRIAAALDAADGRIAVVQLREQVVGGEYDAAEEQELQQLIAEISVLCRNASAALVVNRRPDLLPLKEVQGVHIGSPPKSLQPIRTEFPHALIGYSAHSLSEACSAEKFGADYILVSPVFAPLSKKSNNSVLGVEELARIAAALNVPVYALGGITPARLPECRRAGAAGAAMLSYVLLSPEPAEAVRLALKSWWFG